MEMEVTRSKPPKSAREYYVQLYCKKKKSMSSKGSSGVHKALKSWWSLSAAEQQPFVDKFNLIQEKYSENYANYLNLVEPFMKKKEIRERDELNTECYVLEPEINDEKNYSQPFIENAQNINESNSKTSEDSDHHSLGHAASVIDIGENNSTSPQEINHGTEEIQTIPEPTPPCAKNARELFEMVNNVMKENNLQWNNLSQVEKKKYQNAVLAIKREYLKKYQNYVESLPSKELFQHYIKTLDKY